MTLVLWTDQRFWLGGLDLKRKSHFRLILQKKCEGNHWQKSVFIPWCGWVCRHDIQGPSLRPTPRWHVWVWCEVTWKDFTAAGWSLTQGHSCVDDIKLWKKKSMCSRKSSPCLHCESITSSPPLGGNEAASQSHHAGNCTWRQQQKKKRREEEWMESVFEGHIWTTTEKRHKSMFIYLLLSFCTSLSSSSFSLVIKLWRTGISNFMYCATLWKKKRSVTKKALL